MRRARLASFRADAVTGKGKSTIRSLAYLFADFWSLQTNMCYFWMLVLRKKDSQKDYAKYSAKTFFGVQKTPRHYDVKKKNKKKDLNCEWVHSIKKINSGGVNIIGRIQ